MKQVCSNSSFPQTRKLLGVHALGQRATEIIHIGQAVLFYGGSVEYFRDVVFNYPTLADGLQRSRRSTA
jgi:NAD(P) transhydrogenase